MKAPLFHVLSNMQCVHMPWIKSKCSPESCKLKVVARQLFFAEQSEPVKKLRMTWLSAASGLQAAIVQNVLMQIIQYALGSSPV